MTGNNMKSISYVIVFVCGILATFFIYSCSNDEYYADEAQREENSIISTRALSSRTMGIGNTLIDSIAASDEFWEFQLSSELLAQKFDTYVSSLGEEDYDKLMENLNNDDYMNEFIQVANMEEALQQMNKAKENLVKNTGFLRLSEDEKAQLIMQFAESKSKTKANLLKTRQEGGNISECEKKREAEIQKAEKNYNTNVLFCDSIIIPYLCYIQAASKRSLELRVAEGNYQDCLNNN